MQRELPYLKESNSPAARGPNTNKKSEKPTNYFYSSVVARNMELRVSQSVTPKAQNKSPGDNLSQNPNFQNDLKAMKN